MTKTKLTVIIAVTVSLVLILASILFALDHKYNMRGFFKDWEAESNDEFIEVLYDSRVIDKSGKQWFDFDDILSSGTMREVFCVKDGRVYFSYSTAPADTKYDIVWHIASVDTSGKDLKEHYSGKMFDNSIGNPYYVDFSLVSYLTNEYGEYGGLYSDNKIYLYGNKEAVAFDIETEKIDSIVNIPERRYDLKIENFEKITIRDKESDLTRTVTLKDMAKSNIYAKRLYELSSNNSWNGKSLLKEPFQWAKIVDDQIYFVCRVANWSGEYSAVLFRYDVSSDMFYYLSSVKIQEVEHDYIIAPCYGFVE